MIKQIDNVKLNINESESNLLLIARKNLGRQPVQFRILKKSLDARDKGNICWVYSIAFSDEPEKEERPVERIANPPKVAIIGSGPAGLLCAVRLIEHGFTPVIIERGGNVEERRAATDRFFTQRIMDTECNVQFGEGGAGTFSDGKLNTQTRDGFNREVLKIFRKFGAPEEILYLNKPHIGSDILFEVLKKIRGFVEANGGKYLFNTKFKGLRKKTAR